MNTVTFIFDIRKIRETFTQAAFQLTHTSINIENILTDAAKIARCGIREDLLDRLVSQYHQAENSRYVFSDSHDQILFESAFSTAVYQFNELFKSYLPLTVAQNWERFEVISNRATMSVPNIAFSNHANH